MPPRFGNGRNPYRALGDRAPPTFAGVVNALRASSEMTSPAVRFALRARFLAACNTSSAISRVVRMHQMLMHHTPDVNGPVRQQERSRSTFEQCAFETQPVGNRRIERTQSSCAPAWRWFVA